MESNGFVLVPSLSAVVLFFVEGEVERGKWYRRKGGKSWLFQGLPKSLTLPATRKELKKTSSEVGQPIPSGLAPPCLLK